MIRFRCACGKSMKAEEVYAGLAVICPRCGERNLIPSPQDPALAETGRMPPVAPRSSESTPGSTEAVAPAAEPAGAAAPQAVRAPSSPGRDSVASEPTRRAEPIVLPHQAKAPASPEPPRRRRAVALVAACAALLLVSASVPLWYVPRILARERAAAAKRADRLRAEFEAQRRRLARGQRFVGAAIDARAAAEEARSAAEAVDAAQGAKAVWSAADRLDQGGRAAYEAGDYEKATGLWKQAREQYAAARVATPLSPELLAKRLRRLAATAKAHRGPATTLAVSPDGRLLVTGGDDHAVRVWDAATGRCVATLSGHTGDVNAVAFSPDGSRIASAGDDRILRLWNVETFQPVGTFEGHTDRVRALAFGPPGMLASAGDDRTVRLWDVVEGKPLGALEGRDGEVRGLVFSPDGSALAACGIGFLRTWKVVGRESDVVRHRRLWALGITWSPDGATLALSGIASAGLWRAKDRRYLASLRAGERRRIDWRRSSSRPGYGRPMAASVAFEPKGRLIAIASGADIALFEASRRRRLATISGGSAVRSIVFAPDGRTMVSAHGDGRLRVWGKDE
jgi:phage FluMu protein Com